MSTDTIKYNGLELRLTQDPYIEDLMLSGMQRKVVYQAHAVDENDDEYIIIWNVIDLSCEDESEACDWDKFTVKAL